MSSVDGFQSLDPRTAAAFFFFFFVLNEFYTIEVIRTTITYNAKTVIYVGILRRVAGRPSWIQFRTILWFQTDFTAKTGEHTHYVRPIAGNRGSNERILSFSMVTDKSKTIWFKDDFFDLNQVLDGARFGGSEKTELFDWTFLSQPARCWNSFNLGLVQYTRFFEQKKKNSNNKHLN